METAQGVDFLDIFRQDALNVFKYTYIKKRCRSTFCTLLLFQVLILVDLCPTAIYNFWTGRPRCVQVYVYKEKKQKYNLYTVLFL